MNAKVAQAVRVEGDDRIDSARRSKLVWSVCACASFFASAVFFLAGVLASIATETGLLQDSPVTARWTLAVLLAALVLAFGGAHALDKLDAARNETSED